MPVWLRTFEPLRKAGKIALVGIVQEQHAERARLYAQWRGIEWPILVDSLNLYGNSGVPIVMMVDEVGRIVRKDLVEFLKAEKAEPIARETVALDAGVGEFLAGRFDAAVTAFGKRKDAVGLFRLGVALRARSESKTRRPSDGQSAVDAWQAALALNPNQYIWRRRLQQYGPRLAKPYNFYGWIREARREIEQRGETPLPLAVEPKGAELIDRDLVGADPQPDRDPEGRIDRDESGLIAVESIVTPSRVRPGDRVRVRLLFRPGKADWNDEGEPLTATLKGPGFRVVEGRLHHPKRDAGLRVLECEIEIAADAKPGKLALPGYALYDVCVRADGVCVYRRSDLALSVVVDPDAVRLR